jgi:cytoskeletal protein RodZ
MATKPAVSRRVEFEKLPGGIFTTSYLKQYASAVGMPDDELLNHYARKTGSGADAGQGPHSDSGSAPVKLLRGLADFGS